MRPSSGKSFPFGPLFNLMQALAMIFTKEGGVMTVTTVGSQERHQGFSRDPLVQHALSDCTGRE
jgi:hypothetical protein